MQKIKAAWCVLVDYGALALLQRVGDRLFYSSVVRYFLYLRQKRCIECSPGKPVSFYPIITNEKDLVDTLARACWYLGRQNISEFVFHVSSDDLAAYGRNMLVPPGFDQQIYKLLPAFLAKTKFVVEEKSVVMHRAARRSVTLYWRKDAFDSRKTTGNLSRLFATTNKAWCVDPENEPREGANYTEAADYLTRDKERLLEVSRQRFRELRGQLGHFRKSNIIATGPSFSEWRRLDCVNTLNIVCNSTISNSELMERVRPQILVFADPIFHFGPSEYAAKFRAALRQAAYRYEFSIIIPSKYIGIFTADMPDLANRVIALPFSVRDEFNVDLNEKFEVRATANILTFLMLPIATTFAEEAYLIGCDGRPLSESDYFWKHDPSVQYKKELSGIQQVHKSFFAINYNDYYKTHCDLVFQYCNRAEANGRKVYSAAPSHIPALSEREFPSALGDVDGGKCEGQEHEKLPGDIQKPRVLVIDPTLIGSASATGQLKQLLFLDYPREKLMQVHRTGKCLALLQGEDIDRAVRVSGQSIDQMLRRIRRFGPDVIYFRSVGDRLFDLFVGRLLSEWPVRLVMHVADDWISRMRECGQHEVADAEVRFRRLLNAADERLSIVSDMSDDLKERYGWSFTPIANGVPSDLIAKRVKLSRERITIRYLGAMAADMNLQSIVDVANSVNTISDPRIVFEIYTSDLWISDARKVIRESECVRILDSKERKEDYWSTLHGADILLIAYNFDTVSQAYTRHSFANKLPECMASGAAILGYGPVGNATLEFVQHHDVGMVVQERNPVALGQAIKNFVNDRELRNSYAERGLHLARERFQQDQVITKFRSILQGRNACAAELGSQVADA
ncbi:MAG: hypothetical protein ABW168_16840 [Sedimenticola sp.]